MDAKLKAKWVKALRSGKFKQARGVLRHSPTRMCCLGVLRYLADPKDTRSDGGGLFSFRQSEDFGLRHSTQRELAKRNDGNEEWKGKRQTFQQIADYIEKNL